MNATCQHCGKDFRLKPYRIAYGEGKFCSMVCGYAARAHRDPMEFLVNNYIPEPNSGCWLWLGPYNQKGYGVVTLPPNKKIRAHRAMLELHNPSTDKTLFACHRCDVPACINPGHLFWGTAAANQTDAMQKSRLSGAIAPLRGEANRRSKLSAKTVREIRESTESSTILAARFGVVATCIRKVRLGQTWRHII